MIKGLLFLLLSTLLWDSTANLSDGEAITKSEKMEQVFNFQDNVNK